MEKKPKPEQCIKGICQAIEDYCNGVKCPSSKTLDDVEGMLMIFFRKGSKARLHLIGQTSMQEMIEVFACTIEEMRKQQEGEIPKYAA